MRSKYLISILLLCVLEIQVSFGQTTKSDSLVHEIQHARGKQKLELMLTLANLHQTPHEQPEYVRRLEQEAIVQNNKRYIAVSYVLKAKHYTLQGNLDSTLYWAKEAETLYEKYKIKNPGQIYYFIAQAYMYHGHYSLAIYNLQIYLDKNQNDLFASDMLARLYLFSERPNLAKKEYLRILEQTNENTSVSLKIFTYMGLAMSLNFNKEYQSAFEACSVGDSIFNKHLDEFSEVTKNTYKSLFYNIYASNYIEMQDAPKAKFYIDKFYELPQVDMDETQKHQIMEVEAQYFILIEDYIKSLNSAEQALSFFEDNHIERSITMRLLSLKIACLEKLGRYKDANEAQRKLIDYKYEMYKNNGPEQVLILMKDFELKKVKADQEKDKALLDKSRTIIAGLIITLFFLCIILYLVRRNSKEVNSKNKILYKQNEEMEKYVNLTKEYKNDKILKDKEPSLFDKIEEYMSKDEAYKTPNLTREDIAKTFNTNWKYIIEAIKEETGKTYLDYVHDYRLNHAYSLIISDKSIPVGNIMLESGFSSSSTFYRLFKQKFGMTPNELRETKMKLECSLAVTLSDEEIDNN